MPYKVAAFYQFAALPDFRELRAPLRAICAELELKGSVLLAEEGINGTLAVGPLSGWLLYAIKGVRDRSSGWAG